MGVINPGGSGGISSGTAAARPPAAQLAGQLYWATDTDEISFSDGAAWNAIAQTSAPGIGVSGGAVVYGSNGADYQITTALATVKSAGTISVVPVSDGAALQSGAAAMEAATATAGTAAALPATPQGYLVIKDHNANIRKIPFYLT